MRAGLRKSIEPRRMEGDNNALFWSNLMWRRLLPAAILLFVLGCSGGSGDKPSVSEDAIPTKSPDELVLPTDPRPKSRDQQTVQFLGSQGTGRRFALIADHSMSLSPASLGLIKREMLKTLNSLDERSAFYISFFSRDASPMPGGNWLAGGKDNVAKVEPWIAGIDRVLGTKAGSSFANAYALKPPPDVIFLMTDGQLQDPERVSRLVKGNPKVTVNTILFRKVAVEAPSSDPARQTLERIAREGRGDFKQFIDPDVLPKKKKKKA